MSSHLWRVQEDSEVETFICDKVVYWAPYLFFFFGLEIETEPAYETLYVSDPVMDSVQIKYSHDTTKQLHKSSSLLVTFSSHSFDFFFFLASPSYCS
jgi:hypothetical protein